MKTSLFGILVALPLALASFGAAAQISGGGISGGGVSGGGISGISGVSGGLAIDFAAGQAAGASTENDGGLAKSLDAAFGDEPKDGKQVDKK